MSVTGISASILSAYMSAQAGLATSGSAASSATSKTTPPLLAPWQSASTAPKESALVQSVLNGQPFFSNSTTKVSGGSGANGQDYQNLFTLYQGVTALQGLAAAAAAPGATATQLASYQKAFAAGLSQLQSYTAQSGTSNLKESAGIYAATETGSAGVPEETDTYTTAALYTGAAGGVVPAFQGDVAFSVDLTNPVSKTSKTVSFDLSQMGSTPRTMANVVNYLNAQLKAAGAQTTFSVVTTPGTPVTTSGSTKTTVYTPPDSYALEIKGVSNEVPTFSAGAAAPTVFITAGLTAAASASTTASSSPGSAASTAAATSSELLSFNGSEANTAAFATTPLAAASGSSLATATGPDGSVYVLANVAPGAKGQAIQGTQDVALMKFDSAGNLVYTQDLGASTSASGYQLSVSPDGSEVAVVGSASGSVAGAASGGAASGNGFVAAFNTASGAQLFSAETPSLAGTTASAVTFGADDSVYVAGQSSGRISGAVSLDGGTANYVQGFSASGAALFTAQFGSSSLATTGLAVSGTSLYLAGVQNGDGVVQSLDLSSGVPALGSSRNLGAVSGPLAGLAVGASGQILVAGTSTHGGLAVGGVTTPYAGGSEGFVASLSPDLSSSADALTYVPGPTGFKVTGMTAEGEQVYLVGEGASGATSQGYAVALDPSSGSESWSTTFSGGADQLATGGIAVSASGSSVLDALGLPQTVAYAPSDLLTSTTSLVAGDSFKIEAGSGPAQTVTISASDTLSTLENKIRQASGNNLTVSTSTVGGTTVLKLAPANTTTAVKLIDGPAGADALVSLGLSSGTLSDRTTTSVSKTAAAFVGLGLNLSPELNLGSPAAIAAATQALKLASAKIQTSYQTLVAAPPSASSTSSAASAALSKQVQAQISNYQQALSWLEGNSSTSTTTTTTGLASLLQSSVSSSS